MKNNMQEIELKGLKEKIYYTKANGMLPIFIWQNERVNGVYCALNVRIGSIHQEFKRSGENKYTEVPSGIAHFLEHLAFYEEDGTTATDFYSQYGSEVNAFTTFDYTSYFVYSIDKMSENLEHLLDFVLTPSFTKAQVNKERSIITEELKADEDIPETALYFANLENVFHKYKYNEKITGALEDVKSTTYEDLNLVYDTFYHPENMFLVVTGNVNPYEVESVVESNLKEKNFGPYEKPKVKKYKEPVSIVNKYTEMTGNVENSKVKIAMKTPLKNFKEIDEIELRLIISLIINNNFGPTSDLKEYLMEKELINYMVASRSFIEDYVIITVSLESKYPKEAIAEIVKQLQNLTMTEKDLKRKVNSNIATLILNYENIVDVNNLIQEDILSFNKIIDNVKEHLEHINKKQVGKVMKNLDTKNIAVTILNPKK